MNDPIEWILGLSVAALAAAVVIFVGVFSYMLLFHPESLRDSNHKIEQRIEVVE